MILIGSDLFHVSVDAVYVGPADLEGAVPGVRFLDIEARFTWCVIERNGAVDGYGEISVTFLFDLHAIITVFGRCH